MTTNMQQSKVIEIGDIRSESTWRTRVIGNENPVQNMRETALQTLEDYGKALRGNRAYIESGNIREAFVSGGDAPLLLRDGITMLAYASYLGVQPSWPLIARLMNSTRKEEEYLLDSTLGALPKTPSGVPAPRLMSSFAGGVKIVNDRYAGRVDFTGEDLMFDRTGKMTQVAEELGRSGRTTEEQAVFTVVANTANYTRNSTTGDNDVGANTGTTTFNGVNLETAATTISTMKDRKSGEYLGLVPDTIVIGPRMEIAVKQLLLSVDLARVGGNTTNEVRGTGTMNAYRGMLKNIIVSPWFANLGTNYGWLLMDSTRTGLIFQRVKGFEVAQAAPNTETRLIEDVITFVASGYFGVGIVDDRPMYLSDSVTAPTVS